MGLGLCSLGAPLLEQSGADVSSPHGAATAFSQSRPWKPHRPRDRHVLQLPKISSPPGGEAGADLSVRSAGCFTDNLDFRRTLSGVLFETGFPTRLETAGLDPRTPSCNQPAFSAGSFSKAFQSSMIGGVFDRRTARRGHRSAHPISFRSVAMAPKKQTKKKSPPAGDKPASTLDKWRRERLPIIVLLLLIPILVLSLWGAITQRNTWQDWLSKLKPAFSSGLGIGSKSDKTGSRSEVEEGTFDYLGEGVARLGEYSIKVFDPVSKCTLRTDFRLEGKTTCEHAGEFDDFKRRRHRFFQEQVMIAIRNSELDDLTDPKRTMLSKKLIARVNRALDERFLDSVVFKEFYLFESVDNSGFVQWQPTIEAAP
jgi:hypothetical protein